MELESLLIALVIVLVIVAVIGYYTKWTYYTVSMKGNDNGKRKKNSKTLPPFPNGWFIACKSEQLPAGNSISVDLSGHNIVVFRGTQGQLYALHAYCAHLGANLGMGGKVINKKCIQCPFHGWLYHGQTGELVDYDGNVQELKSYKYEDKFGRQCKKVEWIQGQKQIVKLRKYNVKQLHGFIYVWIHSDCNRKPQYQIINIEGMLNGLSRRGQTIHRIRCHAQDIPENGADIFHFRYVHKYIHPTIKWIYFLWQPKWMQGTDKHLQQLFTHKSKIINNFKQSLYHQYVQTNPNLKYYSFANIDNYIVLPFLGKCFIFNLTVVQMGTGLVYIFFKSKIFTLIFVQYLQTKDKMEQILYHQLFASGWLPYWATTFFLYGEALQVYNDLLIWDTKIFGYKFYLKNNDADEFILKWRKWISLNYQGCDKQLQNQNQFDW